VLPSFTGKTNAIAEFDVSSYSGMGYYRGKQEISVRVKDRVIATWVFTSDGPLPDTRIMIPPDLWDPDGRVRITFVVDAPISPAKEGLAPDSRALGIYLCGVRFVPASEFKSSPPADRGCS
jgi:hypothetical protein